MRADMLGLKLQSIQLLIFDGLTLVFVEERSLMIMYLYVQYMISVYYGAHIESMYMIESYTFTIRWDFLLISTSLLPLD